MNKVLKMRVMKMIKKNFFLQFFVSGDRIQKLFFAKKKKKNFEYFSFSVKANC